ncbi:hypothetical protein K435DRAFT_858829 [Dendrothele bispora CBS 962.96]|uniref:Uncharacterized protein n=1 Tax=Dendrothele bispora (strain CBS 962.96) TaxID=1314807 RepID=A0A4S8M222_DENBC|nr:hypothetical protein K435DRAFT_858829 [Dendrothele bispora CBS 962.96]
MGFDVLAIAKLMEDPVLFAKTSSLRSLRRGLLQNIPRAAASAGEIRCTGLPCPASLLPVSSVRFCPTLAVQRAPPFFLRQPPARTKPTCCVLLQAGLPVPKTPPTREARLTEPVWTGAGTTCKGARAVSAVPDSWFSTSVKQMPKQKHGVHL